MAKWNYPLARLLERLLLIGRMRAAIFNGDDVVMALAQRYTGLRALTNTRQAGQ